MANTRFFSGARDSKARSAASDIIRFEMSKKGKLTPAERYKRIMKKKFEENKNGALLANKANGFQLPGSIQTARKMSKETEKAFKQMAAKKAAKQAKAERKMVIIQPRNFSTGTLNKKGQIFDIAGNMVGQVSKKNGAMATMSGWKFGQYKPKSFGTNIAIQDAINKFSPYYINLRKMQAMQQGAQGGLYGPPGDDVINVHGAHRDKPGGGLFSYNTGAGGGMFDGYGADAGGPRQNVGVTAWGAASDNVWGTFADNVWGTSTDNVWGSNSTDIWGGIGGSPFGNFAKTVRIWGSGNGPNYLKGLGSRVAAFFGLRLKSAQSSSAHEALVRRSRSTRASTTATRAPAPTTRSR